MSRRLSPLFTWRSAIAESDYGASVKAVAYALSLHMNERGGSCFPAVDTLAGEAGCSERTAQRALRRMEADGYLEVELGGGRGNSSTYTAQVPETVTEGHLLERETVTTATRNGVTVTPEGVKRARTEANASVPHHQKPRPTDPLWDALAGELGEPATRSERGRRNKAVKELRDVGASAGEVRLRVARYKACWPGIELTATGLAANWSLLAEPRTVRREVRGSHGSSIVEAVV